MTSPRRNDSRQQVIPHERPRENCLHNILHLAIIRVSNTTDLYDHLRHGYLRREHSSALLQAVWEYILQVGETSSFGCGFYQSLEHYQLNKTQVRNL